MASMSDLELHGESLRDLLAAVTSRVQTWIDRVGDRPAAGEADPEALRAALDEPLPETGRDLEGLLERLFVDVPASGFHTAGPGFMAYIPGGGLPQSAAADLIAGTLNRYATVRAASPGMAAIEAVVVRWLCELVGYRAGALGTLTSGGSLATFSAVVAAREDRLGEDLAGARLYMADQAHGCVPRAARLAGLPRSALCTLPTSAATGWRLQPQALADAIARDRAAGRRPFMVVASAGTVNTGAVDDLVALSELCAAQDLWLHVDAAYGGCFVLTERGRARLAGIERADSIVLDPHKGFFLPYGTGALLVKDGAALYRAHRTSADYLPAMDDDLARLDPCQLSPELSRAARGVRLWLPLQLHGASAFRAALDEKLDLAAWAAEQLAARSQIDLIAPPELSLLAFRWTPPGVTGDALDALNVRLLEAINARGRVHLSGTKVDGRFVLRICVLSVRTHAAQLRMAIEDLDQALAALEPGGQADV